MWISVIFTRTITVTLWLFLFDLLLMLWQRGADSLSNKSKVRWVLVDVAGGLLLLLKRNNSIVLHGHWGWVSLFLLRRRLTEEKFMILLSNGLFLLSLMLLHLNILLLLFNVLVVVFV